MSSLAAADAAADILAAAVAANAADAAAEADAQAQEEGFEGAMLRLRVVSPDDEEIWLDGISVIAPYLEGSSSWSSSSYALQLLAL